MKRQDRFPPPICVISRVQLAQAMILPRFFMFTILYFESLLWVIDNESQLKSFQSYKSEIMKNLVLSLKKLMILRNAFHKLWSQITINNSMSYDPMSLHFKIRPILDHDPLLIGYFFGTLIVEWIIYHGLESSFLRFESVSNAIKRLQFDETLKVFE